MLSIEGSSSLAVILTFPHPFVFDSLRGLSYREREGSGSVVLKGYCGCFDHVE